MTKRLLTRAQELAGENLSAVIVRSLREFIVRREAQGKGMKEITVQVGSKGLQREQHFSGRLLLKWQGMSDDKERWLEAKVYKTVKGKYAIELTNSPHPDFWRERDFWKHHDVSEYTPETSLVVGDTVEDLHDRLPHSLVSQIEQAEARHESPVEFLDI